MKSTSKTKTEDRKGRPARLTSGARLAGALAATIGVIWVLLWIAGEPQRLAGTPVITVKTNMAVALVLTGVALVLASGRTTVVRRVVAAVFATVVFLIGAVTGFEHLLGVNFGIDQLIFTEPPGAAAVNAPNRMGPPGALCLTLTGIALLLLASGRKKVVPCFGVAVLAVAFVPGLGYLYGVTAFYGNADVTGIAWSTVIGLMAVAVGLILSRTDGGAAAQFLRKDAGGTLLRRLFPATVLVPIAAGYLRTLGEKAGLFTPLTGRALLIVILIMTFSILLWITATRLSKAAASEAESETARQYLSAIVESSQNAIFGKTLEGTITSWNSAAERLYGYAASEAIGQSVSMLIPQNRPDELPSILDKLAHGEAIEGYESVRLRKDGSEFPAWVTISPIRDDDGRVIGASTIVQNLTERKAAEEKLRASEEKFRAAFLGAAVGMGRVSFTDARWMDANNALCRIVGYTPEEMRATPWPQITHPDDIDIDLIPFQRMSAGEIDHYTVEKRFIHKQGHIVWARLSLSMARDANGNPDYEIAVVEDITERKRAEKELEHSRKELQFALQAASAGAWSWRVGDDHFVLDVESQKLLYMPEDATLRNAFERIVPEDQAQIEKELRACAQGLREYAVEFRVRSPQGVTRWIEARGRLIEQEGVSWIYGINHDITQRKVAEQALRESEQRFRSLSELVPQLIWTAAPDGEVDYVNERWTNYTGQTVQEATGRGTFAIVHPDDVARSEKAWKNSTARGEAHEIELRLRSRDGEYRWFLARGMPLRGEDGRVEKWFGTCTDIDEMKRAQQLLIRSEKLASAGRMAATVAHEINNPLELITNCVFLAGRDQSLTPEAREHLATAEQELERVAHLTRKTLGFYREKTAPTKVDVAALVREVVDLYAPKLAQRKIVVESEHGTGLHTTAVAGELRQVVSNIVSNAIDATAGGRLRVRTSRVPTRDGCCVRMTFADTGEGISAKNMARLFEPFFTTKETVGTGLGLWVCAEIVRRHHGTIRVRSRQGQGTVFSIFLPQVAHLKEKRPDAEEISIAAPNPGGR